MWSAAQPSFKAWSEEPLTPSEVLYDFDGPLTFTAKLGFFDALFHKVGERSGSHYYLAVQTSADMVRSLRDGVISVRGALKDERCWIVEMSADLVVRRFWSNSFSEIPEKILPQRSAPLYHFLPPAPDTLVQAQAFFSIAFGGDELKTGSFAFSLLKQLIDKSYDAVRRVLSPVFLAGAKSATYDFPAMPVPGSLILALGEPLISEQRLRRRTASSPVSVATARLSFDRQRTAFFDEMSEIIDQADRGEVRDSLAEERFSLLDNLQHIIPSDNSRINRVEFTRPATRGGYALTVGEKTGTKIHRAFKRIEKQAITDIGVVEIINSKSKYFVYKSTRGKQVACHIPVGEFERLVRENRLASGVTIKVRGHLSKRPNRDELYSEYAPDILYDVASVFG